MDASARERARGNRGAPRGDDEGDARARRRTNEPRGDSSGERGWARARGRGEEREGVQTLAMKYEDRPLMDPRAGEARLVKRERRRFHDDYWTASHLKLLYLVSKYSNCAQTVYDKERWVRKLPLLVLIYEGIVQKVFEYDYAPESTMVKNTRLYLNVSQEGVDDLDDLIEGELIRGLRLKSTEHQSVLAFQITTAGLALVSKRMSEENRQLGGRAVPPMGSFLVQLGRRKVSPAKRDYLVRIHDHGRRRRVVRRLALFTSGFATGRRSGDIVQLPPRGGERPPRTAHHSLRIGQVIPLSNVTILVRVSGAVWVNHRQPQHETRFKRSLPRGILSPEVDAEVHEHAV